MLTIGFLLLKLMICSGILYGYYHIALRNKVFHRWNRFYLLATVVLSLAIPFIKINISQNYTASTPKVFQFLNEVNSRDEITGSQVIPITLQKIIYTPPTTPSVTSRFDYPLLILSISALISLILLFILVQALIKIEKIKLRYPVTILEGINFRNTDVKGTPFSFFRNIFWNNSINIQSTIGTQIFQHELVHIREKHSHDKMFINLVLVLFWFNPFFWLIKRELNMIHEFIADEGALENGDSDAFAAMVLQAAYPRTQFRITNNFFYSPIKRRLKMLLLNKNPKLNYLGRLMVLPVAAVIFFAFTLRLKNPHAEKYIGKKFTVIIDAGHGGNDNGMIADGVNEKDITLSIAKKIKSLNTNENIEIILSRNSDENIKMQDRIGLTVINQAGAFISLHLDGNMYMKRGASLWIPKNENAYFTSSSVLGSNLLEFFKNSSRLPVSDQLNQRDMDIWELTGNQCPAVLLELASLGNDADKNYILKNENQDAIALIILDAINKNAGSEIKEIMPFLDNRHPESVAKITEATKPLGPAAKASNSNNPSGLPLYIRDGIELGKDIKITRAMWDQSIGWNYLNSEEGIKKYGDKGKFGVTEITSGSVELYDSPSANENGRNKNENTINIPDHIFEQAEIPNYFEGTDQEWKKYLQMSILRGSDIISKDPLSGTFMLRFMVDKNGRARNIEVLSSQNSKLAEVLISAILGGKWKIPVQNGQQENSYKTVVVTTKNLNL